MVVFQALTWETEDKHAQHLIHIFGKTQDGKSVCVTTEFSPYFFIKLPTGDYLSLIHISEPTRPY